MKKPVILAVFLLAAQMAYGAGHLPEQSGSMVLRSGQTANGFAPAGNLPDVTGSSQFLRGFDFVKEEIRALRKDRQAPADFGKYVGRIPPAPARPAAQAQDLRVRIPVASAVSPVQTAPASQPYSGMQDGNAPVFDFRAPAAPRQVQAVPREQMRPYAVPVPRVSQIPDQDFPDFGEQASVPIITPESIRRGQTPVEPRVVYVRDEKPVRQPQERARQPQIQDQAPYAAQLPPGALPPAAIPPRPVSMLMREGDMVPDDAPPIEEIEQGEWERTDDPYLARRDVSGIPFALKKNERPVFYFCPYNSDSTGLWRDIRQNADIIRLLEEGAIDVSQPVWTSDDIPPAIIFEWLKTFDLPAALDFMDFEASMPEGWLDVAHAGYLSERERLEKLDHYLGLMEQWLIDRGIDAEPLFIDRGVQMGLARRINTVNETFRKLAKDIDKHPAVFINGRRNEGYFEKIRTLPMHQR